MDFFFGFEIKFSMAIRPDTMLLKRAAAVELGEEPSTYVIVWRSEPNVSIWKMWWGCLLSSSHLTLCLYCIPPTPPMGWKFAPLDTWLIPCKDRERLLGGWSPSEIATTTTNNSVSSPSFRPSLSWTQSLPETCGFPRKSQNWHPLYHCF